MSALPLGKVLGLAASEHDSRRGCLWSGRSYAVDVRSKMISMVDTVREEMRDQVALIISSVDSLMVANVLILELAAMFACEGTFPKRDRASRTDDDYVGWEYVAIHAYSVCLALTMAFSLGSLLAATAVRLEAQACFVEISGSRLEEIWQRISQAVQQREGGPHQLAEACDDTDLTTHRKVDGEILRLLTDDGVFQKARYYYILHPIAQFLMWLCLLCAVAACTLLMSLITSQHYPSNPRVTLAYSGTVGLGFLGSLAFGIWMGHSLSRRTRAARLAREQKEKRWREVCKASSPRAG